MNAALKTTVIGLSLFAGVTITIWGFVQNTPLIVSKFEWRDLAQYAAFLVVGAFVVDQISKRSGLNIFAVGAAVACIIAVLVGAIWPLIVAVWFAVACFRLGLYVLRLLRINATKITAVTAFLTGACVYGTAVGLLAHYPVNYPGLYGIALAAPVLLGWRSILPGVHALQKHLVSPSETRLLDLAIVFIALIHFTVAFMPEVGHDALAMHLFVPAHLASRHEWGFAAGTYVWAVMPMLGDWLFSIGYMLAGEQAARLINVGFIFVLSWLVRDLVLWAHGSKAGARWAVLLFLTTPLTFTESSSLFIESVWASFVVAGSLFIFKILQSDDEKTDCIPLAGLLLGGALAAKAVTFTILPVLLLVLIWRYRAWAKPRLATVLALGFVLLLVIGLIPYATAWHLTGNPVFPFFNHLFQSPLYPALAFDQSSFFVKGVAWDILYQVTFHSGKYLEGTMGAAGFQWLLLFTPALLILIIARQRCGLILFIVAILCCVLTFQQTAYLRYVFPSFAWVAAGIGAAVSVGHGSSVTFSRLLFVIGWSVILLNVAFFKSGTTYGGLFLQPLMSKSGRDTYLNNRLPIRNAVELVNNLNTARSPVAMFSAPLAAGLRSDALYPSWYNHRFRDKVFKAKDSGDMAQILLNYGVDFVMLDDYWVETRGMEDKRNLIEKVTRKIAGFANITVRKLDNSFRFQTELLENTDFVNSDGWNLPSGLRLPEIAGDGITVTAVTPAVQTVEVMPERRYQNSVTAKCADQPGQGRVQVNWLDKNGGFISTDIYVFNCTLPETTRTIEVIAPANATIAAVYATGHSNLPIIITKVSFRQW